MARPHPGRLIIIGGHEQKQGEMRILHRIASHSRGGGLVVATLASVSAAEDLWRDYRRIFRSLGIRDIRCLDLAHRGQASQDHRLKALEGASCVFFTGGDQLRITSQIGGTPIHSRILELHERGGTICGTSAGASVMSEVMLVSGKGDQSYRLGEPVLMSPGLGLIRTMIIDQHFAERGRIGRMLGVVAQNPKYLGIGIDEDTAIITDDRSSFEVLGSGAVYVLDGHSVSQSNIADSGRSETLSIFGVKLHVLSDGDRFDLREREPSLRPEAHRRAA